MVNLTKEVAWTAVQTGARFRADVLVEPRFKLGDNVRALNIHPEGYTRLPRYVRDKVGIVERAHGGFVFADTVGRSAGDDPQHLYGVRFSAAELWGPDASPKDAVSITLWESHLEPAAVTEEVQ